MSTWKKAENDYKSSLERIKKEEKKDRNDVLYTVVKMYSSLDQFQMCKCNINQK